MKEYNIPMALFDFVPVILFYLGLKEIWLAKKDSIHTSAKITYFLGYHLAAIASGLKALYKLLYAMNADIAWMSNQFFTNQAFGFLLIGTGMLLSLKPKHRHYSILPVGGLVGMVVLGETALYGVLYKDAREIKKTHIKILLILSYTLSMCMGYLSSKNFDAAWMNWFAQSINTAAQLTFLISVKEIQKNKIQTYDSW